MRGDQRNPDSGPAHQYCLDRNRNLVLIGYRATGKTSVGQCLATRLHRSFVDLDQVLAAEAGQTIAELVAQYGWAEFRRREKALVVYYAGQSGLVLATGGGAVLDPENVQNLRQNGLLIWLTADATTIRGRLSRDREEGDQSRPTLTGSDSLSEVAQVLADREPLYRAAADLIIDTAHHSLPQVVEEILQGLSDHQ